MVEANMGYPFRVQPSKIHGDGMFATCKIVAGAWYFIATREGKRRVLKLNWWGTRKPGEPPVSRIIEGTERSLYRPFAYMNHSEHPNAVLWATESGLVLEMLTQIECGEEITVDYEADSN